MTRTSSRWAPSEATVYDLASTRSSTPIAADAPSVLGLQAYRAATAAAVRDARTYSSVAPNAKIRELVLNELLKWQFRPAVRDGAPITVEVLLAIPPQDV